MNKIKYLIFIFFALFFVSGCTVQYELEIDENLQLHETIIFQEENSVIKNYNTDIKKAMEDMINYYTSDNINPQVILNNEVNLRSVRNNDKALFGLEKDFENIDEYSESLFFRYYFKTSSVVKEDSIYTIFADVFNFDNVEELTKNATYNFDMDKIIIKITLPYKVLETNTSYIDRNTNTYYWFIENEESMNNYIKLVFDTNEKVFIQKIESNGNFIEDITSDLITNISGGKADGDKIVNDNKLALYGILVLIVVVIVVVIVRKKLRKNNEI